MRAEQSPRVQSFAPILGPAPKLLILGSMPGVASLQAAQYYAHPRNRFWPLLEALLQQPLPQAFDDRYHWLRAQGIALWDVLAECRRQGSLDSAIGPRDLRINPIAELLQQHPSIRLVATNGGMAAQLYRRHIWPQAQNTPWLQLPSTSPANARLRLEDLVAAWSPIQGAF